MAVFETASCGAAFDRRRHRIRREFTLDSAVRLAHAPAGSPTGRLHGHTGRLRLHLSAPLHPRLGWAVDFGEVKALFEAPAHRPLHEIAGLEDGCTAGIAGWILDQAKSRLLQLDLHPADGRPRFARRHPAGGRVLPRPSRWPLGIQTNKVVGIA